jgi:hypothetical protein
VWAISIGSNSCRWLENVVPKPPFPITVSINPRPARGSLSRIDHHRVWSLHAAVIDLALVVTPGLDSEPNLEGILTGRGAGGACTPTKLIPVFSLLGGGFCNFGGLADQS